MNFPRSPDIFRSRTGDRIAASPPSPASPPIASAMANGHLTGACCVGGGADAVRRAS